MEHHVELVGIVTPPETRKRLAVLEARDPATGWTIRWSVEVVSVGVYEKTIEVSDPPTPTHRVWVLASVARVPTDEPSAQTLADPEECTYLEGSSRFHRQEYGTPRLGVLVEREGPLWKVLLCDTNEVVLAWNVDVELEEDASDEAPV